MNSTEAAFYLPSRGLRVMLARTWKRYRCGRRFGHFRSDNGDSPPVCFQCNAPLM